MLIIAVNIPKPSKHSSKIQDLLNSSTQHSHGGTITLRNSQHRELGINSSKESHKTPDLETHI